MTSANDDETAKALSSSTSPDAPGAPTPSATGGLAPRIATAPGKLLLAGEYAVLEGNAAVVVAVDRRATARRGPRDPSPFLDALAARLAAERGHGHACARAATDLVVDTADFSRGGQKLGLGSSAAATVAAAALALAADEASASASALASGALDRDAVFALAAAAHGDAQGARGTRGSGADIAASTYGGALAYSLVDGQVRWRALPVPRSVLLLPFFTGHSADTVTMVAKVHAAAPATRRPLDAIAAAAAALAAAFERDDGDAILRALRDGGDALAALGVAAGHDLETAAVRAVRDALAPFGGAVKTTGAGGGDLAIAAIPCEANPSEAAAAIGRAGCQVVPLAIDPRGVDLRGPAL